MQEAEPAKGQAREKEAAPTRRAVAAFDFDGTLVGRDSLLPWLAVVCGRSRVARAMAAAVAASLERPGRLDRDRIKAHLLSRLLGGRELAALVPSVEAHAARLVSRLRPQMTEHIRAHQSAGDWVVIVSASPELYLAPVGEALGLDAVIGTRLEIGADGRLTGRLEGPNCRGPEKVARLSAWMDHNVEGPVPRLYAYGDSAGDNEMMALADVATWVGRRERGHR